MKKIILNFVILALANSCFGSDDNTVRKYIFYIYGDESIKEAEICHFQLDNWMIPGKRNEQSLNNLKQESISIGKSNVYSEILGTDIIFTEIKDGKIDTSFTLEGIYGTHKQLIRYFFYYSLLQDRKQIARFVTK